MNISNNGSNQVTIHDSLGTSFEEQYQSGIKDVTIAAGGNKTINNDDAAESKSLGGLMVAGTVAVNSTSEGVIASSVTYDTGGTPTAVALNVPATVGSVLGNARIIGAGVVDLAASATHLIALTPLTANAAAPDTAILGHINPNDVSTPAPYGVIAVSTGSGTLTTTEGWTAATSATAGDADAVVTFAETGTSNPIVVTYLIVARN